MSKHPHRNEMIERQGCGLTFPSFVPAPGSLVKMILKYLYYTVKLALPYMSFIFLIVNVRKTIEAVCRYKTTKALVEHKSGELSSEILEGVTEGIVIEENWKQLHS